MCSVCKRSPKTTEFPKLILVAEKLRNQYRKKLAHRRKREAPRRYLMYARRLSPFFNVSGLGGSVDTGLTPKTFTREPHVEPRQESKTSPSTAAQVKHNPCTALQIPRTVVVGEHRKRPNLRLVTEQTETFLRAYTNVLL